MATATSSGEFPHTRTASIATIDVYLVGVLLLAVLIAQQALNNGVTSDGCLYFAYLRSLVFDRDVQIGPELEFLRLPPRPHGVVPIGPAIVWAPLYGLVAVVDWLGAAMGLWARTSGVALGLTSAYVRAAFVSSFAIATAGLVALHWRIRREFGPTTALLTSLLILGATTLAWYVILEPSMTHAASFGAVALALICTERWLVDRAPSRQQAIGLGALFSLVILIRPEDGLFLAFPVAALLFARVQVRASLATRARIALDMLIGATPLLVLQGVMLVALMSSSSFTLAGDEGYLSPFASRWIDVLFSSRHGLFSWTPVVWVGLLGTWAYVRRQPIWALSAIFVFVALVWINGSAHDWAGGWAFGGRRFTSVLAALAPGFGLAIAWVQRRPLTLLVPAVALIVGWNGLLMTQYQREMLPRDETVRFDTLVRQQTDLYLTPPYWYPFAFPANVWFAWRERLPVDRYDLLGSEPLRQEMYLPLNEWGARFLSDGWTNGAGDSFGSRHFLVGQSGSILVPLDVPGGVPFLLDIEARAEGPAAGTTLLDVAVNGRSFGEILLSIGAAVPTRRVFTTPAGAKLWRRGYNRVTLARRDLPPATQVIVYALRLGPAAR